MLTYSPSIVAASVKILEESATPDVQCTFAPGSFKNGQIGELEETRDLSAGAWQMRPLSRGYVEAKSNRAGNQPALPVEGERPARYRQRFAPGASEATHST
jgi:choline dehydrogenase